MESGIARHHFPVADPAAGMAPVVESAKDVLSCIETSESDRYDALDYATAKEGRTLSSEGLVALAPLAITCMAHDAGMPVQIESEYLPKHLVYTRSSR
ncbi:Imm49 family immunity protein [Streptomyces sp. NPDC090023]|uniref:Imm49 family immunity protein n=1 Tax=unclassified Streptomyces TaxID=2593676 RepID=UPI00382DFEA6